MACWQSSPEIREFMNMHNYTRLSQVQEYYAHKHIEMIKGLGLKPIVWQDPLDLGVKVGYRLQIQGISIFNFKPLVYFCSWIRTSLFKYGKTGGWPGRITFRYKYTLIRLYIKLINNHLLQAVLNRGYKVILSAPWYLNYSKQFIN